MPIGYDVWDHRSFFIDFTTASLVGLNPQPIQRPTARRLNTKIPRCSELYNSILEAHVLHHRIIPMLNQVHSRGGTPEHIQTQLDAIDRTTMQLIYHMEHHCCKLKSGQIPFSPKVALWIKCTLVYRSLLPFWAGKIKNTGNLIRQAR